MRADEEIPNHFIAVNISNLTNRFKITERFAHFNVIHINIAVMHPVSCKRAAVCAFALRNLIFVVRKNKIFTAAVDIDRVPEIFSVHGRAFNMPAGSSLPPRGIRLAGFCSFPKRKIKRIFFHFADRDPCAAFQIFNRLMRKFSVFLELQCSEINVSPSLISIAFLHKRLNNADNFINILSCFRMHGCMLKIKSVRVRPEFLNIFFRYFIVCGALFVGSFNDLIINIRKILHEFNMVSPIFQITPQHIKHAKRPCISDMDIVIYRWPAGIDLDLIFIKGYKFFFLPCHCIIDLHLETSSSFSISFSSSSILRLFSVIAVITGSGMWI